MHGAERQQRVLNVVAGNRRDLSPSESRSRKYR